MTAYQESKLSDAQYLLAEYIDISVNCFKLTLEESINTFLYSKYSSLIENGNTFVLYGKTGAEIALDIFGYPEVQLKEHFPKSSSKEFWTGWVLAFIQWKSAYTFEEITSLLEIKKLREMYYPYHEMDERVLFDDVYKKFFTSTTKLARMRKKWSMTQTELAKRAGVSKRTIQMVEQKQNDINSMKAVNLYNISRVLNCNMEDLLE